MKKTSTEHDDLKAQIANLTSERDKVRDLWMEETRKSGQLMGASMELAKLSKQVRTIEHIAAGRHDAAILEIITPMPVIFNVDVRFADDKDRMAAEEELFESMKTRLTETIGGLFLRKKKDADATE